MLMRSIVLMLKRIIFHCLQRKCGFGCCLSEDSSLVGWNAVLLVKSHWCYSSLILLGLFDHENEYITVLVKVGSCLLVPEAWNLQRIITS